MRILTLSALLIVGPSLLLIQSEPLTAQDVTRLAGIIISALSGAVVLLFWIIIRDWRASLQSQLSMQAALNEHTALLTKLPEMLEENRKVSREHADVLKDLAKAVASLREKCRFIPDH